MKFKLLPGIMIASLLLVGNSTTAFATESSITDNSSETNVQFVVPEEFMNNETISVEYFSYLLEQAKLEQPSKPTVITIDTVQDMYKAVEDIFTTLPSEVIFESSFFKKDQIEKYYNQAISAYSVNSIGNYYNLAFYKEDTKGRNFRLIDNSSAQYSAKEISVALDQYTDVLAAALKGSTQNESVFNLYNYIFDNFKYDARSFRNMYVGNIGEGATACNGFSRLANDVLNKMGIRSEIREGTSHFWNIVYLGEKGSEVPTTFDITSDIVLEERYATLGNSTKEHLENTANINFYSANYHKYKYEQAVHFNLKDKNFAKEVYLLY